jgi:hypothetical protein
MVGVKNAKKIIWSWGVEGAKGSKRKGDSRSKGREEEGQATAKIRSSEPWSERQYSKQGCGSVFISSGSGSSILGRTPIRIRIRIQSGSSALMTENWKKISVQSDENFF